MCPLPGEWLVVLGLQVYVDQPPGAVVHMVQKPHEQECLFKINLVDDVLFGAAIVACIDQVGVLSLPQPAHQLEHVLHLRRRWPFHQSSGSLRRTIGIAARQLIGDVCTRPQGIKIVERRLRNGTACQQQRHRHCQRAHRRCYRTRAICSRRNCTVNSSSARPTRSNISSTSASVITSGGLKHRMSPGTVRPITPFSSISLVNRPPTLAVGSKFWCFCLSATSSIAQIG